jgi:hypothetical protein
MIPVWVDGLLRRSRPSKEEQKKVKDTWDKLADDFLALDRVAGEIEAMKRLWPQSRGLCERRDREAGLWRKGLLRA